MTGRLYNSEGVCELLGIKRRRFEYLIREYQVAPASRAGGRRLYDEQGVDALREANRKARFMLPYEMAFTKTDTPVKE